MEPIKKQAEQQLKRLSEQSASISPSRDNQSEISIYTGQLTGRALIREVARIQSAFPSLPKGFYDILTQRLKDNNFSDERLRDCVNHVIDSCVYPTPTIAQFIGYDRRYKVYTYEETIDLVNSSEVNWSNYISIQFPDRQKLVWVHVDDIKRYNLDQYLQPK